MVLARELPTPSDPNPVRWLPSTAECWPADHGDLSSSDDSGNHSDEFTEDLAAGRAVEIVAGIPSPTASSGDHAVFPFSDNEIVVHSVGG